MMNSEFPERQRSVPLPSTVLQFCSVEKYSELQSAGKRGL